MKPATNSCIDHGLKGNSLGYGRTIKRGKNYLLHRLAFCSAIGIEIESIAGKLVLHSCDNPRCINPEHLSIGTNAENMRDMSIKRRAPGLKLTVEQVMEIKATCSPNKPSSKVPNPYSYRALARKFGVTFGAVRQVHIGRTHKYVGATP